MNKDKLFFLTLKLNWILAYEKEYHDFLFHLRSAKRIVAKTKSSQIHSVKETDHFSFMYTISSMINVIHSILTDEYSGPL
jgi:hypothetical protein